jgi:hypothetical protein
MNQEEAIAFLAQQGLTVTESMTTPKRTNKQPKPVWLVTGRVDPFRQLLYDQGGGTRFTGRNTFSFWSDPTINLAEAIEEQGEASLGEQVAFKDERSQARADRSQERAQSQQSKSADAYRRSHAAVAGIPMGQPILVGHHSEGRHRRDIAKSHAAMGESVAASQYAEHLEERAAGSARQIKNRQTIEYMGNRLEEARTKLRAAEKRLQASPHNRYGLLDQADAEQAIAHWTAEIEAAGGMLSKETVNKKDWVFYIGKWYEVIRVSAKSVTVTGWLYPGGTTTIPYHCLNKEKGHKTAAQMQATKDEKAKTE